jgi:hypothetical protein
MKRKIKIDNLITQDKLAIFGNDWVSTAMDLDRYENGLALIVIDDPTDFEIEIEVDKDDKDILLRVSQKFYIPVQMKIMLEKNITHVELNRLSDPIY